MIPAFQPDGTLPPGIHSATWGEVEQRFGIDRHRLRLLAGLRAVLQKLSQAGCQKVYLDGSFVTEKDVPGDFDAAWDMAGVDFALLMAIEPALFDFSNRRAAQKAKYLGELFPAELDAGAGRTFLEFFQIDKNTGNAKGIVAIDLRTL